MIYVFDRDENFLAILSNDKPNTCPYWNADVKEVLNGEYTFTFTLPFTHPDAAYLQELGYVAFQDYEKNYQLFVITEIEELHSGEFIKEVTCEHASVEMYDDFIEYLHFDSTDAATALPAILQGTKWSAGTIQNLSDTHDITVRYKSVREAIATFAERWGVELQFRITISGNAITGRYIDALTRRGAYTGKRFEYRKDISEIRRTVLADNVKTALYGYGKTIDDPNTPQEDEKERYSFINEVWSTEPVVTNLLPPAVANMEAVGNFVTSGATATRSAITGGAVTDYAIRATVTAVNATYPYLTFRDLTTEDRTPVTPGDTLTVSVYMRTNTANLDWRLGIYFYRADNTYSFYVEPWSQSIADTWVRHFYKVVVPADAVSMAIEGRIQNPVVGLTLDMSNAQAEENPVMTSWLSGGTTRTWGGKPIDKPLGQSWIGLDSARDLYGKKLVTDQKAHRFGKFILSDEDNPAELLQATYDELLEVSKPSITYQVKVVDLMKILGMESEAVHLGDDVNIIDADLNLRLAARIIQYNFDLTIPEQSEVTLGNFEPKFTSKVDQPIESTYTLPADVVREGDISDVVRDGDITDVLRQGSTIQTSWLEGAIDAAQNQINAGVGTVTITDDGGILIVDDPVNPQKAIKLIAGTIALANSRDTITGLFNWRTFGTAEGWLADLVQTGFLKFDRSQGGTLTLGGAVNGYYEDGTPTYQNGVMNVVDSSGNLVVSLTGDNKGFDKLFVGELSGNNVVLRNVKGAYSIYVDPVNGDDANDGSTTSTAFKTLQKAIDSIPLHNNFIVDILVQGTSITWVENISIAGFVGAGKIRIFLGKKNTIKGQVYVAQNMNEVIISTDIAGATSTAATGADRAQIQGQVNTNGTAVVFAVENVFCYLLDVILSGNSIMGYGFNCSSGYIKTELIEVYNCTNYAGIIQNGSRADIVNCAGSNPKGLRIAHATIVGGSGRGFYSETAGQEKVVDQGAYCNVTWTYNQGAKTPLYAPVTVSTWEANDTQSLFGTNWGLSDYIYTGKRNSSEVAWQGFAFFTTADFSVLKNADGTNRTIQKVRIKVQRYSSYGENTPRKPTVYHSTQATASGTPANADDGTVSNTSFLWGEEKWIDLPIVFGQSFQAGTAKSIVFYNGNDLANYMRFEARMTLEITHG